MASQPASYSDRRGKTVYGICGAKEKREEKEKEKSTPLAPAPLFRPRLCGSDLILFFLPQV